MADTEVNAIAPQPYQADYMGDLEDSSEVLDTSEEKPKTEENTDDTSAETEGEELVGFEKRYKDLQSYNAKQTQEHMNRIAALEKQVSTSSKDVQDAAPTTPEAVAKWQKENPEAYDLITNIADIQSRKETIKMESKLSKINDKLETATRDKAMAAVKDAHRDFDAITADDQFHIWLGGQPKSIQGMIYENAESAEDAIYVIDMYKEAYNLTKEAKNRAAKETAKIAAQEVNVKKQTDPEGNPEKTWKLSDINSMNSRDFEKHEDEIDKAVAEGRIVDDT